MRELDRFFHRKEKEKIGVRPVGWEQFHALCKGLAMSIAEYDPDMILGNARGGLYPATLLSHMLQKDLFPIRLSRRENDVIVHEHPIWYVQPPKEIKGKRILVVDEISSTGEELRFIKARCKEMGAKEIRSAVTYAHTKGADVPDYIGFITDELILNPWDREVYDREDFVFVFHPEYEEELMAQGIRSDKSFKLPIKAAKIAKSM